MKKCRALGLIGLAVALASGLLFAEEATEADARMAARGWSLLNGRTFGSLGSVKDVLTEKDDQGRILWYVVVMDGGAAVVSPDTEIEPVIAVMPGSDGVIPRGSALDAMLRRDLANRLAPVRRPALKLLSSAVQAALQSPAAAKASGKWDKLRRRSSLKMLSADGSPATIVKWLDGWNSPKKVGNVQTLRFWNQNGSPYFTNKYVFDLYTPGHCPCGCVATAGSAIMHYFRAPRGRVVTRGCTHSGTPVSLTTKGGTYDWSLIDGLPLDSNGRVTLSDAACDLLARVASDCGIGCEMQYAPDGSGSLTSLLAKSFRDVFGVRQVQLVYGSTGPSKDIGIQNYAKIIYNQIRAGAPIALGIDGHEVVACGYGFDDDLTDYTYVFLGWGGANDAWYALPNIDTKATVEGGWYTSTFIDELLTEISFDDRFVAVCGRLVDIDGNPVSGVNEDGTPNADALLKTSSGDEVWPDKNGYWGVRVDPKADAYLLDSLGIKHFYEIGDAAKSTSGTAFADTLAPALPEAMEVQLLNPSVEVYVGETCVGTNGSIDAAIETARPFRDQSPRLVVIDSTVLQSPCTVDFSCTITATNPSPWATAVTCRKGALLTVTGGAAVTFTNAVFQSKGNRAIKVLDGSCLRLAGAFGLDLVETDAYTCLELVTTVTNAVEVDCQGATGVDAPNNRVAWSWLPAAEMGESANHLLCPDNDERGGFALDATGILGVPTLIVWKDGVPVPDAAAKVKLTQGDAVSVNYRSFAALLKHYSADLDAEIRVCQDCPLKESVGIRDGKTLTFVGGSNTVAVSKAAGFAITESAKMVVSNVTFGGMIEPSLFAVGDRGGSSGELVFGGGAAAVNVSSRSEFGGGVVCVYSGRLAMEEGSRMVNCRAERDKANGGAVYLGPNAVFDLAGGVITSCRSANAGGGVYVYAPATVNVSGASAVFGNVATEKLVRDDIYFENGAYGVSALNLTGRLTGENGAVGVRYGLIRGFGEEGDAFADLVGISGEDAEASAPLFLNDAKADELVAVVSGEKLVWTPNPLGPGGCAPEDASIRVVYPSGDTNFYAEAETAFANLTGPCAVELLTNVVFTGCLPVWSAMTLRSAPEKGEVYELRRNALGGWIVVQAGAALTAENVRLDGNRAEDESGLGNLIEVAGGELVLKSGAAVGNVLGCWNRADGAITVWQGGHLVLEAGACVTNSCNCWEDAPAGVNCGVGGGILIDGAGTRADFRGGLVADCGAIRGGGVAVANEAQAFVSGDFTAAGSTNFDAAASNFMIEDRATLVLADDLTGSVGISEGIDYLERDANVFGRVDDAYYARAGFAALTNSAANFHHDLRRVRGVVATNGTPRAVLVWSDAFADEGGVPTFTDKDGNRYGALGELPPPLPDPEPPDPTEVVNPDPIAFSSIEKVDDKWVLVATNAKQWCWYSLWSGTSPKTNEFTMVAGTSNQWTAVDGPITNEVPVTDVPARFWVLRGAPGKKPVQPR